MNSASSRSAIVRELSLDKYDYAHTITYIVDIHGYKLVTAEGEDKLLRAVEARRAYSAVNAVVKEPLTLTEITTSRVSIPYEQNNVHPYLLGFLANT